METLGKNLSILLFGLVFEKRTLSRIFLLGGPFFLFYFLLHIQCCLFFPSFLFTFLYKNTYILWSQWIRILSVLAILFFKCSSVWLYGKYRFTRWWSLKRFISLIRPDGLLFVLIETIKYTLYSFTLTYNSLSLKPPSLSSSSYILLVFFSKYIGFDQDGGFGHAHNRDLCGQAAKVKIKKEIKQD